MKRCPKCDRRYDDDTLNFCLDDGEWLHAPRSEEAPPTAIISSPDSVSSGVDTDAETKVYTSAQYISKEIKRHKFGAAAIALVGCVVLAGFGYGVYRLLDWPEERAPARTIANIQTQRLTGDGKARDAEISPDGKFLAYTRADGGERSIWLKQIQTNSNIAIVEPGDFENFGNLAFSPDGSFLYFNAQTQNVEAPSVYRVPSLGGTPTKVFTNAVQVQFSPDGSQVSFGRFDLGTNLETAIFIANADGTNERKVAARSGTKFFDGPPVWSPDGKLIAVPAGDDALNPNPGMTLAIIRVADGEAVELDSNRWNELDDLVWHPSGDSLIATATEGALGQPQLWEISYPSGAVRRLTNNLNGYSSVSITADGKSIVTGELYSRSAIWVSPDLKPENARPVMPSTGDTWGFGWTPDNRIVYVSDQTGDAEVWIMDADGGNAKPLTNDKVLKTTPVVSPDGRYIVYTDASGGGQLIRIEINGANPLVLVTSPGADNPDISPDGKWLIYSAWIGGISKIMRVSIDGGEPQALTDYQAIEPRYSRDGTRFACFMPNETTQNWTRLAIVPTDGGQPLKTFDVPPTTNTSRGPIWTPDDSGITLVVAPGELQNLWLQPLDGGAARPLTNFESPGVARREYSRDGKRIAIVRAQGIGNAIMITGYR